jgi:hypothetical protein
MAPWRAVSREAEVGRVAVQGSEFTGLRDLDRFVELFWLEQLGPEALGVGTDCLDLDAVATRLGGQHLDRLSPVRTFQDGALAKLL